MLQSGLGARSGGLSQSPEGLGPVQSPESAASIQQDMALELESIEAIINGRIAEQKKMGDEKESLVNKLEEDLKRIQELKRTIQENNINERALADAQSSLAEIQEAGAIADLRATAAEAMTLRDPESLARFKSQAAEIIQNLPNSQIERAEATQIVEEIVSSEAKDVKLGFFQRFLIKVQLILDPKKGVKWLKEQIQKNQNFAGDDIKTLEYIKKQYSSIYENGRSVFNALYEKAADEERAKAEVIKQKEPLAQASDTEKGEPPKPDKRETPESAINAPKITHPEETSMSPAGTPEKILEAMSEQGKAKRAELAQARSEKGLEMMSKFIDGLKEGERSSTPSSRVRLIRTRMINDFNDNIYYTEEQIDSMFDQFAQIEIGDSANPDKVRQELSFSRESVKDLYRSRSEQQETMSRWYSEIESSVQGDPQLKTKEEKEAALAELFTKRFMDTILADHAARLLEETDTLMNIEVRNRRKEIFYQAIESGQISLEFYDGMPVLKFKNAQDAKQLEASDGIKKTYTSAELMALINGESLDAVNSKPEVKGKSKTPLGLFIKVGKANNPSENKAPNMIAIDVEQIKAEDGRHFDKILNHEIRHMRMLGLKEEKRTFLINRQVESLTRAKWATSLVESLARPETFRAEIESLRARDSRSPRISYLERIINDPEALHTEVHAQLVSFIKSEYIPEGSSNRGNELFKKFAENKTASKFQIYNATEKESYLEEFVTNSIDTTVALTLGDLGFDHPSSFLIEKPEHQTLLGLMRIVNMTKEKELLSTDIHSRTKFEDYRIQIADYFGSIFTNLNPNLGEFRAIITSAINDETHPLYGALKALNSDNLSAEEFLDFLLNKEISEQEALCDSYTGGLYKATNNKSDLRHSATHQKDAYYYGPAGFAHRMGGGQFGAKQDLFSPVSWFHQKDKGPGLFQLIHPILGTKKFFMDGLGIGQNKFHLDSNDGIEAISFATGIPFHRMPFMKNFAKWLEIKSGNKIHLEKKEWLPSGIFTAEPSTYLYYTLNVIYGKLQRDHRLDNMALIKLLPEMGGFDYDSQGQPVQKISSYATRADQYRLNDQLADFIEREIIYKDFDKKEKRKEKVAKRDADGEVAYKYDEKGQRIKTTLETKTREDLERIVDRLRSDQMVVNGKKETVYFKEGKIITKKLYEETKKTGHKTINQILLEDKAGNFKGCIVQEGRLRLGQVTQSTVDEIKEMMYIPANHAPRKVRNPWGLEAIAEDKNLKDAEKNIKKMESYDKIAKYIMEEDDRRYREEGRHYTITELYEEMCRAQSEPWPDLYKDGAEDKEAEQRYLNPTMLIGDKIVGLNDVKEFIKDFSMARANKVLSVGVWGQEPNYDESDTTDYNGFEKFSSPLVYPFEGVPLQDKFVQSFTHFLDC